jgi:hypothetical protein
MKLVPVTVRVVAALPTLTVAGETVATTGTLGVQVTPSPV